MTTLVAQDFTSFVFAQGDDIKTTSLLVAEKFKKRHDDVLKKLRSLECSADFTARNFAVSEYKDSSGKSNTMYEMTKDGFIFLVMGFTGKAAAQVKEAYINAFNLMMDALRNKSPYGLKELPASKFVTPSEKLQLRSAIEKHVSKTKEAHSYYWHRLHHAYHVSKLEELPTGKVDEMLTFLGLRVPQLDEMVLVKRSDLVALEYQQGIAQAPERTVFKDRKNLKTISIDVSMIDIENIVKEYGGIILYKDDMDKIKGVLNA